MQNVLETKAGVLLRIVDSGALEKLYRLMQIDKESFTILCVKRKRVRVIKRVAVIDICVVVG